MFDDPRQELKWLEEELLAEEYEEGFGIDEDDEEDYEEEYDEDDLRPGRNFAVNFGRMVYDDEDGFEDDSRYIEAPKKKGIKGLVFLAFLEILGILAILGWWLRWLN